MLANLNIWIVEYQKRLFIYMVKYAMNAAVYLTFDRSKIFFTLYAIICLWGHFPPFIITCFFILKGQLIQHSASTTHQTQCPRPQIGP